jgi:uncharacterized protein (TIGR00299 family) protein
MHSCFLVDDSQNSLIFEQCTISLKKIIQTCIFSNMKSVHFQMLCGAGGDMILSSLIDLGVPVDHLSAQFARLGIEGLSVGIERKHQGGIDCAHLKISCGEQKFLRHLPHILELIRNAGYQEKILKNCELVFNRLAQAEAAVHGIEVEKVHFHEIGAIDTIVDVLGTCLCLDYLGVEAVSFSAFNTGHGTIIAEHGIMPNPAPATAELIRGYAIKPLDIESEILTPTGAAVLTALGKQVEIIPPCKFIRTGYGCGDRQFAGHPNYLRALLIETEGQPDNNHDIVCVLETDMDHITGEILGFTGEEALAGGALDVTWTPVYMKKGRPGYRLTLLCRPEDMQKFADLIIANTHTLGIRYRMTERLIAGRTALSAKEGNDEILLKNCVYKDMSFTKVEYESLALLARKRKIPLIDLIEMMRVGGN